MQKSEVTVAWPTLAECDRAKEVFAYFLRLYASHPDMSRETVASCTIAKVWQAGRIYQQAQDATDTHADAALLYDSIVKGGAGL